MKRDIADKWVEALESGDYKQARNVLHDSNSFCCLGVLCDLYHKETGKGEWVALSFKVGDVSWMTSLPPAVQEWAQMYSDVGFPTDARSVYPHSIKPGQESLVYLNDKLSKTFPEIAAHIREKVELL